MLHAITSRVHNTMCRKFGSNYQKCNAYGLRLEGNHQQ